MNSTGNGFHDGPVVVSSANRPASRPHTSHANGSNASAHGSSSENAASSTAAPPTAIPGGTRGRGRASVANGRYTIAW